MHVHSYMAILIVAPSAAVVINIAGYCVCMLCRRTSWVFQFCKQMEIGCCELVAMVSQLLS